MYVVFQALFVLKTIAQQDNMMFEVLYFIKKIAKHYR